jgi:AraC family transcriptional regulator
MTRKVEQPFGQSESIQSQKLCDCLGGGLLADSRNLGWIGLQAQAYRYHKPQPESWQIPWIKDGYLIEIQISSQPVEIEQRITHWTKRYWCRGDMVFFPRGETTEWRWSQALDTVAFLIPFDLWQRTALDEFGSKGYDAELIPCFSPEDSILRSILLMIADELQAGGPNGLLFVDGLKVAAISYLLQHYSTLPVRSQSISSYLTVQRFKQVLEFIDANLDKPLSINALAAVAEVGPSYFPRLFRQAMGSTPHQFVLHQRVKRAMKLLANRKLSIAEISLSVGFANQSHFTTAFRKVSGTTPASYRKELC